MDIAIQVIKCYRVTTEGGDTTDPRMVSAHIALVEQMQSTEIERTGLLMNVTTEHAEVVGPSDEDAPGSDYSVEGIIRRQETEAIYLTNGCCENAHGSEALFNRLKLDYGNFQGEFYPLTDAEVSYISEDGVPTPEGQAEMGYSGLYKGRKWLMPSIEVCFLDSVERPFSEKSYGTEGVYKTTHEAKDKVDALAAQYRPRIEALGGYVFTFYDYGPSSDRHTIQILIPFEAAFKLGSYDKYKTWLSELLA